MGSNGGGSQQGQNRRGRGCRKCDSASPATSDAVNRVVPTADGTIRRNGSQGSAHPARADRLHYPEGVSEPTQVERFLARLASVDAVAELDWPHPALASAMRTRHPSAESGELLNLHRCFSCLVVKRWLVVTAGCRHLILIGGSGLAKSTIPWSGPGSPHKELLCGFDFSGLGFREKY